MSHVFKELDEITPSDFNDLTIWADVNLTDYDKKWYYDGTECTLRRVDNLQSEPFTGVYYIPVSAQVHWKGGEERSDILIVYNVFASRYREKHKKLNRKSPSLSWIMASSFFPHYFLKKV